MKNKVLSLVLGGVLTCGALAFTGCKDSDVQVYAPDGAPALALASLMAEDTDKDGIDYTVTVATKLPALVDGRDPTADVCIMPVNQAANLLGDGSTYQMVGLATHGNLYLLSTENKSYTRENIDGIKGKKIGVVNLPNVPGLTLRATLADLGVSYVLEEKNFTADNVYLYGVQPGKVTPEGGADMYLYPEPKVSYKLKEFPDDLFVVGDLQTLYGGEEGYPQACVVAKKTFIRKHRNQFEYILAGLKRAEGYLSAAPIDEIYGAVEKHREKNMTAEFTREILTRECIARSNVRFVASAACRSEVDGFLQKLMAIAPNSASTVGGDFYYIED